MSRDMNQIIHWSFHSNQSILVDTEGKATGGRENQKLQFGCKQYAAFRLHLNPITCRTMNPPNPRFYYSFK